MPTSNNRFNVNFLLSMTRLPEHFYFLLHKKPDDEALMYHNPGTSLLSFLVAKGLRNEFITLDSNMAKVAMECETFSTSANTLSKILDGLMKQYFALRTYTFSLPSKVETKHLLQTLYEISIATKMAYDAFILTQDPKSSSVNIIGMNGSNLKDALFLFESHLEEAATALKFTLPEVS